VLATASHSAAERRAMGLRADAQARAEFAAQRRGQRR